MDLVKRYIAAVQRELPEQKRQEIGRELNANIMDELDALAEQQGATLTEQQVAEVLKNMGPPQQVARQFCPIEPLIPLHMMPLYKHTLVMVLGILLVLQVVFMTKAWLMGADVGLFRFVLGLASGFIEDAVFGFTAITVGFAVAFNGRQSGVCSTEKPWQPQDLPPVAAGWQQISLSDVFTDLASYIFLLLIIWFPMWQQMFAAAEPGGEVFSPSALVMLMWFSPFIVLGIVSSLWQLRRRIWSKPMLQLNIGVNLAFALMFILLAVSGPLLQLDVERWQRYFSPDAFQDSIRIGLVIIGMFPGYEVVRDILRIRRMTHS